MFHPNRERDTTPPLDGNVRFPAEPVVRTFAKAKPPALMPGYGAKEPKYVRKVDGKWEYGVQNMETRQKTILGHAATMEKAMELNGMSPRKEGECSGKYLGELYVRHSRYNDQLRL